jgi:hypothetical protein
MGYLSGVADHDEAQPNGGSPVRSPYSKPRLEVHGTIRDLTRGGGGTLNGESGRLSVHTNSGSQL